MVIRITKVIIYLLEYSNALKNCTILKYIAMSISIIILTIIFHKK